MSGPRFTVVAALLHGQPDLMADDNKYEVFLRGKEAALMAELAAVRATLADLARVAGKPPPSNRPKLVGCRAAIGPAGEASAGIAGRGKPVTPYCWPVARRSRR